MGKVRVFIHQGTTISSTTNKTVNKITYWTDTITQVAPTLIISGAAWTANGAIRIFHITRRAHHGSNKPGTTQCF